MNAERVVQRIGWSAAPERVLAEWARERPVAALWSGGSEGGGRWNRWTVIGEPVGTVRVVGAPGGGTRAEVAGVVPPRVRMGGGDGMRVLGEVLGRGVRGGGGMRGEGTPRFVGGWIGWMSYELGRVIEPAAKWGGAGEGRDDRGWALAEWHWVPAAYVHDGWTGAWWVVGEREWVERLPREEVGSEGGEGFRVGGLRSATGRAGYEAAVREVVERIGAGEIFQANVTHRLSAGFSGSGRRVFARLAAAARPWYGAYIERPRAAEVLEGAAGGMGGRRIVASVSPELFLDFECESRRVVTRPIKGTRRGDAEESELRGSGKDAAELTMIVDLMRNDLGRVAEIGSVRVEELRGIERHGWRGATERRGDGAMKGEGGGGVWHGVGTVSAVVREGVGMEGLVRAAFPAGSITGAPKIRAMQIIEELEPVERGVYCGSIGYVSASGDACLNVAIRTACISGEAGEGGCDVVREGVLDYAVGAGIVAESDPAKEWEETLHKAGVVMGLAGWRRRAAGVGA